MPHGSCSRAKICVNERHSVNVKWVMMGPVKVIEAAIDSGPMKDPIAILWPQKGPRSCELGVAPVSNWHSRQPEIVHQLISHLPKALPIGSSLCTTWRQAYSPSFPRVPLGIARDLTSTRASHSNLSQWAYQPERPGISVLVLKETRSLKAPIERVLVLPRTMRESHLPLWYKCDCASHET